MTQISKTAAQKFLSKKAFKSGNTEIQVSDNCVCLFLYGSMIALLRNDRDLFIDSCTYMTKTTRERLNALPNVSIQEKRGVWYLNGREWNGTQVCLGKI